MANTLRRGGYSQEVPDGIHQHKYAGGGHPGCGGYIEALEIETTVGPIFLIHETAMDCAGLRHRWLKFNDGGAMLEAFERIWCSSSRREGFTGWSEKPFWKAVNYNCNLSFM